MTHAPDGKHAAASDSGDPAPAADESSVDDLPQPTRPASPPTETGVISEVKAKRTRVSGTWVAVIIALLVLIFLLIFILQNLNTATVYFLGASGSLPLAVAMLFSAIAGGLLVGLVGGARILQLRKENRKVRKSVR